MLIKVRFSMQATPDFIDLNFQPSLTCARPTNDFSTIKAGVQLASLITEVKASEDDQNPKYSWMRSEDRNQFDMIMGRTRAIGGHGWNEIVDKLVTTQKWLANQEIEARYAILYKNITEVSQTAGTSSISLRPEKYNVLTSSDIQGFTYLVSQSSTVKTLKKLSIAEQWWDHVQDQYFKLDALLNVLTGKEQSWMTEEDLEAFADARRSSTACNSIIYGIDNITDTSMRTKSVTKRLDAYTDWHTNRQQFRTNTIAIEQLVGSMSPVELAAFNAAKATYSATRDDISDEQNAERDPADRLQTYREWLENYQQAHPNT